MNSSAKGRKREYIARDFLVEELEGRGVKVLCVVRSARSKGPADILIFTKDIVYAVQVKTRRPSTKDPDLTGLVALQENSGYIISKVIIIPTVKNKNKREGTKIQEWTYWSDLHCGDWHDTTNINDPIKIERKKK